MKLAASLAIVAMAVIVVGCSTRPVNAPVTAVDPDKGYRYVVRQQKFPDKDNLVILAFSGGGTRAAAFSYGVLEALERTEITGPRGNTTRLIDHVDIVTGVSGGSFTALAYGLYRRKLFDLYEASFLKRDVQGELVKRLLNPVHWGSLCCGSWGRSELAAGLYDELLFHGATYRDLDRGDGPFVIVQGTDISTGARFAFHQGIFDVICADLEGIPLSRAAATSSAVPFALSPVTLNNYGGSCNYRTPPLLEVFNDPATAPRPAARAIRHFQELKALGDGKDRPYLHLVDGGLADNLGMRGVIEALEELEALHVMGRTTPLDHVKRIVVIIVNSMSSPTTHWDRSESGPGNVELLIKATGVPIDHYSFEAVELIRDIQARWDTMRRVNASPAFDAARDPALAKAIRVPGASLYAIDVSFPGLANPAELAYLNNLPTSFVLPDEAVDRLRTAAGTILLDSPEFKRLLRDVGARVVEKRATSP